MTECYKFKGEFPVKFLCVTWLLTMVLSTTPNSPGFLELANSSPNCLSGGMWCPASPPPPMVATVSGSPPLLLPLFSLICRMRSCERIGRTGAGISVQMCYLMFFFDLINEKWPFMPTYMFISCKSVKGKNGVCYSIWYTFYFIIPSKALEYKLFLRQTMRAHSPSFS